MDGGNSALREQAPGSSSADSAAALPISMVARPASTPKTSSQAPDGHFPGELDLDFEKALAQMAELSRASAGGASATNGRSRRHSLNFRRMVGFDGYRRGAHDEKLERDRRYGTVYSVTEGLAAYLVRLEMPRKIPGSALKALWNQAGEMPDYKYTVTLDKNAVMVKAGVPDESLRRLAYISPSFPADFLTRIEFQAPVKGFIHRMRDKLLEIIVFKEANPI